MNTTSDLKVVYFPSCINRSMGKNSFQNEDDLQLTALTHQLLVRAGFSIIYPQGLDDHCCGSSYFVVCQYWWTGSGIPGRFDSGDVYHSAVDNAHSLRNDEN